MTHTTIFEKCYRFDLADDFFPVWRWYDDVNSVVEREAVTKTLDGAAGVSEDGEDHVYKLLDGNQIETSLGWLFPLYSGVFREMAESAFGKEVLVDPVTQSAININHLDEPDHSYDWHKDTNHCTGILYVNSLEPSEGGTLQFKTKQGLISIGVERGMYLVFDGRDVLHTIESLNSRGRRTSIVMNYYFANEGYERDIRIDKYLYK